MDRVSRTEGDQGKGKVSMSDGSTLNSRLSSAELCRRHGWREGTILVADRLPKQEPGPAIGIYITAVGEKQILAVEMTPNGEGGSHLGDELIWDLTLRDWQFGTQLAPGHTE
jgi:hypothetical protein